MNNIFNFLDEQKLKTKHFSQKVEFYIPECLPKGLIVLIYADGGQGKSYLSLALTKELLDINIKKLIYLDFDNPLTVLKDRGVDKIIESYANLNYIQRSSLDMQPFELLLKLEEEAKANTYKDCVFVVDAIRNFVDITNDAKTLRAMEAFMNIRDAGATIILLHHSNKDGKNYQGSNNIRNSVDCMYQLKKHQSNDGEINITLEAKKERAGIKDVGFCLDIDTLKLTPLDMTVANMNEYEENFVTKAKQTLKGKKLNKTQLLGELGYKKDDKTARDTLDKFTDVFWVAVKKGNVYTYELTTSTTSTTCPKIGEVAKVVDVVEERITA
ncbi:MAG: AAA family ATPase [Campylobacteraceae bacterium]